MAQSYEEKNRRRREKYHADPERRKKLNEQSSKDKTANGIKYKLKAIEYTGGKKCQNPECAWESDLELKQIDFHHVIKQNKKMTFNKLFRNYKWKRIKEEIDRCKAIPLCANCHRLED
tara:strand:- start:155 stop:508 length:354 start_codon:yes stop_codon:yes gene_type:complete